MNKEIIEMNGTLGKSFHDLLINHFNIGMDLNGKSDMFEDFPIDVYDVLKNICDKFYLRYHINNMTSGRTEIADYKVEFKEVHSTSEIISYGEIWKVYNNCCIIATDGWRPVRHNRSNYIVGFFANDFVNDTGNSKLFSIFGYEINSDKTEQIRVKEHTVINVRKDSCIKADCCIIADNYNLVLTIKGTGQTLTLESYGYQPCIGGQTSEGLSYGRWSKARGSFDKIILDNVKVICRSSVPNFTLGNFGDNKIPEIELLNNASIDCPEILGVRRMVQSGFEEIYGSTKSDTPAVYEIKEKQSATDKLVSIAKF